MQCISYYELRIITTNESLGQFCIPLMFNFQKKLSNRVSDNVNMIRQSGYIVKV